nr:MAG TPA: hypothetical protein [Caudoviricetes sp.]
MQGVFDSETFSVTFRIIKILCKIFAEFFFKFNNSAVGCCLCYKFNFIFTYLFRHDNSPFVIIPTGTR